MIRDWESLYYRIEGRYKWRSLFNNKNIYEHLSDQYKIDECIIKKKTYIEDLHKDYLA